jgi:hypothetical protein
MQDGGKIILGLVVFVAVLATPLWYTAASGKGGEVPEPAKASKGERCVADTAYMRANHMDLLNPWRDEVVRESDRDYTAPDGTHHDKSLTRTCLDCHDEKEKFCDTCHSYAGVEPTCWDCHVIPAKGGR